MTENGAILKGQRPTARLLLHETAPKEGIEKAEATGTDEGRKK